MMKIKNMAKNSNLSCKDSIKRPSRLYFLNGLFRGDGSTRKKTREKK